MVNQIPYLNSVPTDLVEHVLYGLCVVGISIPTCALAPCADELASCEIGVLGVRLPEDLTIPIQQHRRLVRGVEGALHEMALVV